MELVVQPFYHDEIDAQIIDRLRENGRANNQQIAEQLGLTAMTVSTRIKRMEDADQLRVVAVSDFSAHDFEFLMRFAVEVDGRAASDVANDLAALPEVFAVHLVTGRYDIDMLVALHNYEELSAFVLSRLSVVGGIRSCTPTIVVDVVKYQFDVAPIKLRA